MDLEYGIAIPQEAALAFEMNSGLAFSADGTTAKVVTTSDVSTSYGKTWFNGNYNTTNAQSLTDGEYNNLTGNTHLITHALIYGLPNNPATYAAALCYNYTGGSASSGDWYLPAICEMGNTGVLGTPCSGSDNIDNIYSNLYGLGFLQNMNGGENPIYSGGYWSSTELSGPTSSYGAWGQVFGSGDGLQFNFSKNYPFGVRCVWAFTY